MLIVKFSISLFHSPVTGHCDEVVLRCVPGSNVDTHKHCQQVTEVFSEKEKFDSDQQRS